MRAEDAGAALCAPPAVPRNYLANMLAKPLKEITESVLQAAAEAAGPRSAAAEQQQHRRVRVLALAGKGDWGPGTGKTALTAVMCADDAVRTAFDDEIYCVNVGDADEISLLSIQLSLLDALSAAGGEAAAGGGGGGGGPGEDGGEGDDHPADNASAAAAIARALGRRKCLVIADDCKSVEHFRYFLTSVPPSSRAVLLFTTQRTELMEAACAAEGVEASEQRVCLLGDLPREQLLRMLEDVAGPPAKGNLSEATLEKLSGAVADMPLAIQCGARGFSTPAAAPPTVSLLHFPPRESV